MDSNSNLSHDMSGSPSELLNFISNSLGKCGNLIEKDDVIFILNLMEESRMLADRCMLVNILRSTRNNSILLKLVQEGGWDTLYKWLQEARLDINENKIWILELLKLYRHLPITVTLLKQNNCAKDIRQLSKCNDNKIELMSREIVSDWMLKVKESSNNTDSIKSNSSVEKSNKTFNIVDISRSNNAIKSEMVGNKQDSNSGVKSPKLDKKSPGFKDAASVNGDTSSAEKRQKPKTVKMIGSKFRSTGTDINHNLFFIYSILAAYNLASLSSHVYLALISKLFEERVRLNVSGGRNIIGV